MTSLSRLLGTLSRSVDDARVLEAIASVPREAFLPPSLRDRAYENVALPIGSEQTISQPLVVARMLELLALEGDEFVLDIGTGSGYHAALLSKLAGRVLSIERHAELSREAGRALEGLGITNVELLVGDGSRGVPERGPFDAINIAAAGPPAALKTLLEQLSARGRLIAPVVDDPEQPAAQRLVLIRAEADGLWAQRWEPVRFVPLVPGSA